MSVNQRMIANNPATGMRTAIITVPGTTDVTKGNAVASVARIMASAQAGQGNTAAIAAGTPGAITGILYSAGTTAVHLFTVNSIDPGIIIAAGQTLYIPGSCGQLQHASANVFAAMVFFNED